jgi:hypothetical protein
MNRHLTIIGGIAWGIAGTVLLIWLVLKGLGVV